MMVLRQAMLFVCAGWLLQVSALSAEERAALTLPASFEGGAAELASLTVEQMKELGFRLGARNRVRKWQKKNSEASARGGCPAHDPTCGARRNKKKTRGVTKADDDMQTGIPGYRWDDPEGEHMARAIEFDKKRGDHKRALRSFRAAAQFKRNPTTLMNIGTCLLNAGKALEAVSALHEARMEGIRYGDMDKRIAEGWEQEWSRAIDLLTKGGGDLPVKYRKYYENSLGKESFPNPAWLGNPRELLRHRCNDKTLRIRPRDMHADRLGYEDDLDRAAHTLAACGVVLLQGVMDHEALDKMRDSSSVQLKSFIKNELRGRNPRAECNDCETTNISSRSAGRWEIKVPMEEPWVNGKAFNNPPVRGVMRRLVGRLSETRLEVDTYSVVTSLAKTGMQHWHADVDPLYKADELNSGDKTHLPPFGFVNFIPLADVPARSGPTDFLLKSHIQCMTIERSGPPKNFPGYRGPGDNSFDNCKHAFKAGHWQASAKKGDSILFDLRTWHRGGQNRAKADRSQVYLTFMRQWYIDAVNFHYHQTSDFDKLEGSTKKRLTRVDQMNYINKLEALILKMPGLGKDALRSVQSDPNMVGRRHDLKAVDEHMIQV